jgi:oxygen-independent coproporphyrinogen-3 oxidase
VLIVQVDIHASLGESVPRYTSYPTVPNFHAAVGPSVVFRWLGEIVDGEPLSLYLHIPYCDRLCWFCACHTKHTLRYEPIASYLRLLHAEIAIIGRSIGKRVRVRAIHFGGGSPTMLRPEDIVALARRLRESFDVADDAAISIEIEPNDMDEARLDALAAIGVARASIGVQDFDAKVQRAINREQSFELTGAVLSGLRRRGVKSINLDLLYGLPHQTCDSIAATARKVLALTPDRLALYGYAHVPWLKKHQNMIAETSLPKSEDRLAQSRLAAGILESAGYLPIGLDHFALPGDSLALAARAGRLRRNFQGYTDDGCETLIGLGASSISRFHQGYAQNAPGVGEYERLVLQGSPPAVRGFALTDDDRLRGWVIERLMCDFAFSASRAVSLFGAAAGPLLAEARSCATDGAGSAFVQRGDLFIVTEEGRPFVRLIAAKFDAYLTAKAARFSKAV